MHLFQSLDGIRFCDTLINERSFGSRGLDGMPRPTFSDLVV